MTTSLVQARGVVHSYEGGIRALDGVSIDFGSGEFVAILGPNGSGKTTLVKHFNGLLKPNSGEVRVNGKLTSDTAVAELSRTVGFVFQNPDQQIFASSVFDEVMFGLRLQHFSQDECQSRTVSALEKVDLLAMRERHPRALSRGQRQRLATASVLAMETPLLVLDEPTTGQDYRSRHQIMGVISRLHEEGKTIIIVTHDMSLVAEYASRAVVMSRGRVLFDDSPMAAFADRELLRHAHLTAPDNARIAEYLQLRGIHVQSRSTEALSKAVVSAITDKSGQNQLRRAARPVFGSER